MHRDIEYEKMENKERYSKRKYGKKRPRTSKQIMLSRYAVLAYMDWAILSLCH